MDWKVSQQDLVLVQARIGLPHIMALFHLHRNHFLCMNCTSAVGCTILLEITMDGRLIASFVFIFFLAQPRLLPLRVHSPLFAKPLYYIASPSTTMTGLQAVASHGATNMA